MTHKRKKITDAIKAKLDRVSGLTTVVALYNSIPSGETQHCIISAVSEDANTENLGRRTERLLTVELMVTVAKITATYDRLHKYCESIELLMTDDPTLGGLTLDILLSGTTIEYEGDADLPYARATLTYDIRYETPYNDPRT